MKEITYQNHDQACSCIFHSAIYPAKAAIKFLIFPQNGNTENLKLCEAFQKVESIILIGQDSNEIEIDTR